MSAQAFHAHVTLEKNLSLKSTSREVLPSLPVSSAAK